MDLAAGLPAHTDIENERGLVDTPTAKARGILASTQTAPNSGV